ncbi:XRE family transcriptional regulator [Saccharospirillum sp. HFRX-1]|uniref:helix-turn-helix domain-containing protein n=1 Tax=unclassified Saccharospirillum TaxID=2633430 RepID=UPI003721AAE7
MTEELTTGLKALRQSRGWSLDAAAKATGVSKAMLGQIERGESSPTLNTLWKLARGYELSFSQLMAPLTTPAYSGDARLEPADSGIRVRPLIPFDAQLRSELLELELAPGCLRESEAHESGVVEHVIVIGGWLSIFSDGDWHRLGPGDVWRFNADQPHGYRNDSTEQPAWLHNLIFYPQGRAS